MCPIVLLTIILYAPSVLGIFLRFLQIICVAFSKENKRKRKNKRDWTGHLRNRTLTVFLKTLCFIFSSPEEKAQPSLKDTAPPFKLETSLCRVTVKHWILCIAGRQKMPQPLLLLPLKVSSGHVQTFNCLYYTWAHWLPNMFLPFMDLKFWRGQPF